MNEYSFRLPAQAPRLEIAAGSPGGLGGLGDRARSLPTSEAPDTWPRSCNLRLLVEHRVSIAEETDRHRNQRETSAFWLFAKTFLALLVVFGIVAAVGVAYRDPIERAGRWFIDVFGYAGMGFGTFLADGLHFPIPPQFYMLAVVSTIGRCSPPWARSRSAR
jgi:hypothetical protein